jgi:hypothetical protein
MLLQLVRFQVHLRRKNNKLLVQARFLHAQKVILPIVQFQAIIVYIVLRLPSSSIADKASFVFLSAVDVQLVIAIEPLSTEATFRMTFETALVYCSRVIISFPHMFSQLLVREQLMLVSEDLLMPGAQITNLLVMHGSHMPVEVRPPQARHIAVAIRAVVAEKQHRILHYLVTLVPDAIIVIRERDIGI